MASKIKIKRSAVAGKVPLTTDLELSELAVNTNDGRLYTKKDNGTESIVEIGGPDFGSRNITTTGTVTGASLNPTSSTVPTNGVYLPSANTVGISTNGTGRLSIDANGNVVVDTNTLYVDAVNNRVGVGSNSPSGRLDVQSTTNTYVNVATTWQNGTAGICLLGATNTSFGYVPNLRFGTVTGFNADGFNERMRMNSSGQLLVGTSASQGSYNLQCFGTGVWGQGAYVNGSDANIKQNIQDLEPALDVIKAMRPVTFQYKQEYSSDQTVQPGFIAQELQAAMAGKSYVDGVVQQGTTHLNVAYSSIIAVLVKAVQELEAKVAALETP